MARPVGSQGEDSERFSSWIARPQSLIALSAVLLSVCGLFVSVYQASLTRRQQRASVWPYVEIAASLTPREIEVRVQNTGVGPARVRAAAVSRDGETLGDWGDLLERVSADLGPVDSYYSLVEGRVLPRDSAAETIWRVTRDDGSAAPDLVARLRREFLEGRIDVSLCYCSVYHECWTSSLQALMSRAQGGAPGPEDRAVPSCEAAPTSGI